MNFTILFILFILKPFNIFKHFNVNQTLIDQYDIVRINYEDYYFYNNYKLKTN